MVQQSAGGASVAQIVQENGEDILREVEVLRKNKSFKFYRKSYFISFVGLLLYQISELNKLLEIDCRVLLLRNSLQCYVWLLQPAEVLFRDPRIGTRKILL